MILFIEHDLLVTGVDFAACEKRVRRFFATSQLVHYDFIEIDRELTCNGTDSRFTERLEQAVAENRRVLSELLTNLEHEGCRNLPDLLTLPQGFQSKMLHTVSHLLDGFFGIDSKLFDIDEISHWITGNRRNELEAKPDNCWLVKVKAQLVYGEGFEENTTGRTNCN